MKWIGDRISFVDKKGRTTIVIEPENKFWINALMGAWVSMWMMIGGIFIWSLEKVILVVMLVFWLYYAVRVSRTFFWLLWGRESIKIDESAFTYKKSIRGYGKAVPYYLENISKIRMNIPKEKSFQVAWESSPWIRGGERLEFDYMNKVIPFGRKLQEKDAKLLYQLVTKRVEERLKKKK
jgi:hypothetical protein